MAQCAEVVCCVLLWTDVKKIQSSVHFGVMSGGSARYNFGQGFISFFPIDPDLMHSTLHVLKAL